MAEYVSVVDELERLKEETKPRYTLWQKTIGIFLAVLILMLIVFTIFIIYVLYLRDGDAIFQTMF